MRKLLKTMICAGLVLALAIPFAACAGDGNEDDTAGGGPYTVTCEDGDYYDLSASSQLTPAGETVTITAEAEAFIRVDGVYANGTACAAGSTAGTYTFTMPEENVTVTAKVSGAEIANAEDGMGWVTASPFLTPFDESELSLYQNQSYSVTFGTDPVNATTGSDGGMTYVKVVSLNEDVIPAEAISGVKGSTPGSGNISFYQGSFKIDRTQIKEGTTTLVFFDNDNDRVISKTVTVVPFGDVYKEEAWTVSVTADLSDVSSKYLDGKLRLYFEEGNDTYVYGSVYPNATQRTEFTAADLTDGKITAQYYYVPNAGKTYRVWVAYETVVNGKTVFYPLGEKMTAMFSSDGGTFTVTATDPAE